MREDQIKINQVVKTPNGPGTVQGYMIEDGGPMVLVRHLAKSMTSTTHGQPQTKPGAFMPLYLYPADDLSPN